MRTARGAAWAAAATIGATALGAAALAPAAVAKNPAPGSKQANRMVAKQLEDRRLVGVRGDGAGVDWLFCADGRYETATTSNGSTGTSDGRGWKVVDARVKRGGAWFEAVVEAKVKGGTFSVAVGRHGKQYLAAVDWEPFAWGDVARSAAGAACR